MTARAISFTCLAAFVATVPGANWMIQNVGDCIPNGPCLVPVGFGLAAPSGVLLVGAALVLRDLVQRWLGVGVAFCAIFVGTVLSVAVASPELAIASGAAFLLAELADLAVFTPLQRRGLVLAVIGSSAVGLVIDSALFLMLAFGSLDHLAGQVVGKCWMVLASLPLLHLVRRFEGLANERPGRGVAHINRT